MPVTATHSPAELEARLRLHALPELGPRRFRRLLQAFTSASAALSAPAAAWRSLGLPAACAQARRDASIREQAAQALRWLEASEHHLVMWDAPAYPALLAELDDAPPLLFLAGDPSLLERPQLAIVGSRRASKPGLDTARAFARSLAGGGFVITSGLALGIDGAAHEGALDAGPEGAGTVAVMGTGIDRIYPARHRDLAHRIAAHGALVSELPLGTGALPQHFPKRNRIVAGLARGVLVVEAAKQSGSLITARLAGEAGREVFAIPGSIHSPLSRGCHALIRQGAKLVETAMDITDELGGGPMPDARARPAAPPALPDHPVLDALGYDPLHLDAIQARCGLDTADLQTQLVELELQGRIARLDDGRYQRLN